MGEIIHSGQAEPALTPAPAREPAPAPILRPAAGGSRVSSVLRLLLPALDAVVEGSWLAVVYLVIQVLWVHGEIALGPLELAVFAGLGLAVSRHRWAGVDPGVAVVMLAAAAGIAGWLLTPAARAELAAHDLGAALAAHPGGWLAAAALLRGAAHANRADDDAVISRTLAVGLPGLAIPWILSGLATPAARAAFAAPAFGATVAFVSTALLAIAVARLETLGVATGLDWKTNRPWLAVLSGTVLLVVAIAVPLAFAVGVPVEAAVRGALGPIGILATAGVALIAVFAELVDLALAAFLGMFGITERPHVAPTATPAPPVNIPQGQASTSQPFFEAVVVAVVVLACVSAAVLVALMLTRRLRTRTAATYHLVTEERAIVVPKGTIRLGLPRNPWRRHPRHTEPTDAVGAYLALLRAIGDVPGAAREESETPAAHAGRLRRSGAGGLPLDLLAADYELARYGERTLTAAEHGRALKRLRGLVARVRG